ncbi:MAG: hypothetical protein Q7T55_25615, partial [Solirubrobacteraceae bacterium]|nr:hypothetical protein [Solirubrobacteraceae bacterium]
MADDQSQGRPPANPRAARASLREGPLAELFRRTSDEPAMPPGNAPTPGTRPVAAPLPEPAGVPEPPRARGGYGTGPAAADPAKPTPVYTEPP